MRIKTLFNEYINYKYQENRDYKTIEDRFLRNTTIALDFLVKTNTLTISFIDEGVLKTIDIIDVLVVDTVNNITIIPGKKTLIVHRITLFCFTIRTA